MFAAVTTNVGELDWVAGFVCVHRQGWVVKGVLPAVDQAVDGLDEAVWGTELKKPTKSSLTA